MTLRTFDAGEFPIVVAHRGASSTHPENTLPAFGEAIRLGAPAIELDVRLTADGHVVVMHDADVSRTTDGSGLVHELDLDRIRSLNAGNPDAPATVPLLSEVLRLTSGRAAVAIEIKNLPGDPGYEPDGEAVVAAALAELDRTSFEGPALVLSFNPRSLAEARRSRPDAMTGLLTTPAIAPADALAVSVEAGHTFLLPGWRALLDDDQVVARAHDDGVRIGTWTVDDAATFERLLDMGVDAIATNDPAMGLGVLARRRVAP